MEIAKYIEQNKEIQERILHFIESENDENEEYTNLLNFLDSFQIINNKEGIKATLHLILKISNNHHRNSVFIPRIEKIFLYFKDQITKNFSNSEIFSFFQNSKRILLLLFKAQILIPDKILTNLIINHDKYYYLYFYPEISPFLCEEEKERLLSELKEICPLSFDSYEQNRENGENDSYICSLIRNDLVAEFDSYVNQTNISLEESIIPSIFETNSFLLKNEPKFIEYCAFFGSIQIFKYLQFKKVTLVPNIWLYAIHSNNQELIHLLEESKIIPDNKTFQLILRESIKCHHNEVTSYLLNYHLPEISCSFTSNCEINNVHVDYCFRYYNYEFFPEDLNRIPVFQFLCRYNYITLVKDLYAKLFSQDGANNNSKQFILAMKNAVSKKDNFEVVDYLYEESGIDFGQITFWESSKYKKLKHVSIPTKATSIGDNAFRGCSLLTEIIIPESTTKIGDNAFTDCKSLKKITILSQMKTMENYIFCSCSSLKEITIPPTVTKIKYGSFRECSSIKEIKIPSSVVEICDGAFCGCTSLTNIIFPSTLKTLGCFVCNGCTSLKTVSIESPIKAIPNRFFKCCSALTDVTIPSSVIEILDGAFSQCTSLININLPPSLIRIGSCVFEGCTALKHISIPSSVNYIGGNAFEGCISLSEVVIPSSVAVINTLTFHDCSSLQKVKISPSVKTISSYSFAGCSSLKEIEIPLSIEKIGFKAFHLAPLSSITVPKSTNLNFIGIRSNTKVDLI